MKARETMQCDGCGRKFDAHVGLHSTEVGSLCGVCLREFEARGPRALPMQVASAAAFQFAAETRDARILLDEDPR